MHLRTVENMTSNMHLQNRVNGLFLVHKFNG